eukprot:scaffold303089_cov32-Tisochrysis_lutea.AAC.3
MPLGQGHQLLLRMRSPLWRSDLATPLRAMSPHRPGQLARSFGQLTSSRGFHHLVRQASLSSP